MSMSSRSAPSVGPRKVWLSAAVALFSLAVLSVRSYHYTAGDTGEILAALVLVFSLVLGLSLWLLGWQKAAISTFGFPALAVVSLALWYAHVWVRLHLEAPRAVVYACQVKQSTGSYPSDLSGYTYRDPLLRKHLQMFSRHGENIRLVFFVATPSVSYWYDSSSGWHYYPD